MMGMGLNGATEEQKLHNQCIINSPQKDAGLDAIGKRLAHLTSENLRDGWDSWCPS